MPKRKGLSNKIRFEIFKRDSFKCQYCGRSAPEVMLHVDHINPVAKGGKNAMTNLITSCAQCNGGKGAIPLSDQSEVMKQKAALDELNERRAQLTMMMEWREGMDGINEEALKCIASDIEKRFKCGLSPFGIKGLKQSLRKFGVSDILESVRVCEEQYLEDDGKGDFTKESQEKAINYIPKVAYWRKQRRENPDTDQILYARGILRNRCSYLPFSVMADLQEYVDSGINPQIMVRIAKQSRNWSQFKSLMDEVSNAS